MANRYRGEVAFEAGGEPRALRLGMNELIALQDAMGLAEDDEKFMLTLATIKGLRTVRKILAHALQGDGAPSEKERQAGDIVTELGVTKVGTLIQEALRWAMPDPDPGARPGKAGSPGGPS